MPDALKTHAQMANDPNPMKPSRLSVLIGLAQTRRRGTVRRRRFWQFGQKYVERPAAVMRLIVAPQRLQGLPSRSYTLSRCWNSPSRPSARR